MNLEFQRMTYMTIALVAGFVLDLIFGDPRWLYHPVRLIGHLISGTERIIRNCLPANKTGERIGGGILVLVVVTVSTGVPAVILSVAYKYFWQLGLALESFWCYQMLATKSLKVESDRVYIALKNKCLEAGRKAVSMIVGRDVARLDARGVMRAAVETVAENTSDGVIAPMLFLAIGGAPLGFFYKAVNTMDSMLGYVEPPYKDIGLVPARMDDVFNFIPARLSALLMLAAGALLQLDVKNGWKIFRRDRCKHASPNSAQTESVCAGLLGLRLAGDAWYHGVLHKKDYIGDAKREIELEDIPRAGRLMYLTAVLALVVFGVGKALLIVL